MNTTILGFVITATGSLATAATVTVDPSPFTPGPLITISSQTGTVTNPAFGSIPNAQADQWAATAFTGSA